MRRLVKAGRAKPWKTAKSLIPPLGTVTKIRLSISSVFPQKPVQEDGADMDVGAVGLAGIDHRTFDRHHDSAAMGIRTRGYRRVMFISNARTPVRSPALELLNRGEQDTPLPRRQRLIRPPRYFHTVATQRLRAVERLIGFFSKRIELNASIVRDGDANAHRGSERPPSHGVRSAFERGSQSFRQMERVLLLHAR